MDLAAIAGQLGWEVYHQRHAHGAAQNPEIGVLADGRRQEALNLGPHGREDALARRKARCAEMLVREHQGHLVGASDPVFRGNELSARVIAVFVELEARNLPDPVPVHMGDDFGRIGMRLAPAVTRVANHDAVGSDGLVKPHLARMGLVVDQRRLNLPAGLLAERQEVAFLLFAFIQCSRSLHIQSGAYPRP